MKLHVKARLGQPHGYPTRILVPDEKVDWSVDFPGYNPPEYTAPVVLENDRTRNPEGWADPEDPRRLNHQLVSCEKGDIQYDQLGYPLNIHGRTGLRGRGVLGRWGANFAADPIITRLNPRTGLLEMVAILRGDCREWAIPGGHVDAGELVLEALIREFREEASDNAQEVLDMEGAVPVYRGYVDDPRNTDNAWMETEAYFKHLDPKAASKLRLRAASDAKQVKWQELTPEFLQKLYASHASFVRDTIRVFRVYHGGLIVSGSPLARQIDKLQAAA